MASQDKWRKKAAELLAAPVRKIRDLDTIIGKVEDQFEHIYAARQRGMAWKDIAAALEDGEPISVDAIESAFKRICEERGMKPPRKQTSREKTTSNVVAKTKAGESDTSAPSKCSGSPDAAGANENDNSQSSGGDSSESGSDLFGDRWVDDGE